MVLCAAAELADDDGLASGCGVGVTEAELAGVLVGVADVPTFGVFDGAFDAAADAVGVELSHVLSAAGCVGVGVLAGLDAAVALAVALLVAPGPLLPLGLGLELGLAGAVGLAGELGGGVGGVDEADGEDDEIGEAAAEDCGQDEIGVGWVGAGVVSDPAPPVRALPPPAAELDALGACWPSRAADTDEVSALRSGAEAARTAPATKTAQASAIAGLISASRQSLARCWRPRPALWPGVLPWPPRRAFQRRTASARKPELAGPEAALLAWTDPERTRARIRSRPSTLGSMWSAAACRERRRKSPKSFPCGGVPSWPDVTITPVPGPRAGPSCHGPYDFSRRRG